MEGLRDILDVLTANVNTGLGSRCLGATDCNLLEVDAGAQPVSY